MRKDEINKAWREGANRIKIGPVTVTRAPANEEGDRKTVVEVDTYFGGREKVADGFFYFNEGNGWWLNGPGTEGEVRSCGSRSRDMFFEKMADIFEFFTPKPID